MRTLQLKNRTIGQTLTFLTLSTNFHPIVELIDSQYGACLTIFSGRTFQLFLEDKIDDRRICIYWQEGQRQLSYVTLSGYSEEKNAWMTEHGGGTIELSTNAGKSKLLKRFEGLCETFAYCKRPRSLSLYKRNGTWGR